MTAAVDETSDQLNQQPPAGPGPRLHAARLASDMDLERVAAQLHLKPHQVEALERDHYEGFAARVFVRGYVRNYARLVGLPVDELLRMFDTVYPDPERPVELRRVGSHKPQVGSGHGAVRMVSWALLLGILALFLVWWAGYLEINGDAPLATAPDSAEDQPATGLLLEPLGQLPAQAPVPAETPGAPADGEPQAQSLPAPAAETATAVAAAPDAIDGVDAASDADAADADAADAEPAAPADAAAGPQVALNLTGPCWVQIRDSSGEYKLIGNFGAGTREVLGGTPPYRVLLGNAAVAELTVDGQPVDLAPHTRGQVARLTLDPDAR